MSIAQQQLLTVWQTGRLQHPLDQALTILHELTSSTSRKELAQLSLGQRDARLLQVHEKYFGSHLHCDCHCPQCHEHVELNLITDEFKTEMNESASAKGEFDLEDYRVNYRAPNSLDLAAIAHCTDDDSAIRILIGRCIDSVTCGNDSIHIKDLPDSVIQALEQSINKLDPQSEILYNLSCPQCDTQWQMLFDIATFVWVEIAATAKRLLQQVHILASAYGWSESEILGLSDARRGIYLEMVVS